MLYCHRLCFNGEAWAANITCCFFGVKTDDSFVGAGSSRGGALSIILWKIRGEPFTANKHSCVPSGIRTRRKHKAEWTHMPQNKEIPGCAISTAMDTLSRAEPSRREEFQAPSMTHPLIKLSAVTHSSWIRILSLFLAQLCLYHYIDHPSEFVTHN